MSGGAHFRPYATALLAVALFSLMDAVMKHAALALGTYSALMLRCVAGLALTMPLWLARGARWPGPEALRVHLVRGAVSAAMAYTFFFAITRMPLAEAIALSFIAPLISLYLAAAMLGEQVRRTAIFASLAGLAGVVVIALGQLGDAAHGDALGVGAVLVSALLYAFNLVIQRRQALLAEPLEVALFQNMVVGAVLVGFAPWLLVLPETPQIALTVVAAAILAVSAAMLFAWAYARAEAQALVPLEYTAFIWAVLFGYLFFAEGVRPATLLGTALIVGACWIAAPRRHVEATAA